MNDGEGAMYSGLAPDRSYDVGRRKEAHDEKDAAPDGEYPEYLISEIVDHDAIQSKPLVRFRDARNNIPR
ncbi:hypothetical protein HED50_20205 [Ochrobactrum oryzae]|nr:hypothetical protein [Brucella oryzae]